LWQFTAKIGSQAMHRVIPLAMQVKAQHHCAVRHMLRFVHFAKHCLWSPAQNSPSGGNSVRGACK